MALDRAITDTLTATDGIRNLAVSMPPRHGKSELCCKYLPAWFLGTYPDKRVIVAGYGDRFAAEWGQKARDVMAEFGPEVFGVSVRADSKASDDWKIEGHDGGMKTSGVGGPLTGRGADLLIIDDPVKNAEEAASQVYRDKTWDWWQSTAFTRLEPGGCVIVIQTRWHEEDLLGRILQQAEELNEPWRILTLPAVNDHGEALWPARYPIEELNRIRKMTSEHWWSALYDQRPTPREGLFFKVSNIRIAEGWPHPMAMIRAWDMAATENDGDFTVGVKMGVDEYGRYVVYDVVRGQWATDERDRIIRQTAMLDGPGVLIRGPQDPGSAGKDAALAFVKLLSGFPVKAERVTGDKQTRADPLSSQVNVGNVSLVRAPWNRDFIEEMRTFPLGSHDDQIDAASDAFSELAVRYFEDQEVQTEQIFV